MRVITHSQANGFTYQLEPPSDIVLQIGVDVFLSADGQRQIERRHKHLEHLACSVWDGWGWHDAFSSRKSCGTSASGGL